MKNTEQKFTNMIKNILFKISIFLFSFNLFGQTDSTLYIEKKIIEHFEKHDPYDQKVTKESLYKPFFSEVGLNLSISDSPIHFEIRRMVIRNPYFSEKIDDSNGKKDKAKNYPRSYSVIYLNHLISLFENGKFVCIDLNSFERNTIFEQQLNSKRFKYHWVIDNKLVAQTGSQKVFWNGEKWKKFKLKIPLKDQPILFDDNEFIVYRDCFGEWGGTVYFYDRSTGKTYFTESTCANTVTRTKDGYLVLANLAHGPGSAELKLIPDPRKLTLAKRNELITTENGEALGYKDKSNAFINKLDLYGIEFFSRFTFDNTELFIANALELTFIAKINESEVEIVNPLFFNDLFTHHPITTQFGEYILINLDFYGTGLYREISALIIRGNKITLIDWNEKHRR